mgnify:CR=1 FL=1
MIPHILALEVGIDMIAAVLAIAGAASAWLVIPWRVGSLEKRLEALEGNERDHVKRMAVVETELKNMNQTLSRIENLLTEGRSTPHGNE